MRKICCAKSVRRLRNLHSLSPPLTVFYFVLLVFKSSHSFRHILQLFLHPGPTVSRQKGESKIIIVAIAVGVTCVLMLLITIAVVMARMNR